MPSRCSVVFSFHLLLLGLVGCSRSAAYNFTRDTRYFHFNLARQISPASTNDSVNFQPGFAQQELHNIMLKYQKAVEYLNGVDLSPQAIIPFAEDFPYFSDPAKVSSYHAIQTVANTLLSGTVTPALPDLPVSMPDESYAAFPLTDFISNSQDIQYYGYLGIGTPPQMLPVQLDTGSADIWVAGGCADCSGYQYQPSKSSTYRSSRAKFSISYGAGAASGKLAEDVVSASSLSVVNQTIGVVNSESDDFSQYPESGIMGAAFSTIATSGSPTFFENLMMRDQVAAPFLSVHLARNQPQGSAVCFGCYDATKALGPVTWNNVTSKTYWSINMDGVRVNATQFLHTNITAAIDTGTTLIYLPDAVAQSFYAQIPGAKAAPQYGDGFYIYPCASDLQLALSFGGAEYAFEMSDFNLGRMATGSNYCVGGVLSLGDDFADDLAIIGDEFLKSWYSVFDYSVGARVGFSPSVNNQ